MKKLSLNTVVAIGVGSVLFFVLGKISIPSPVVNTYISLQYAVQTVIAAIFGPIVGTVVGFLGHTLIDVTGDGPWWSWVIASASVGFTVGFLVNNVLKMTVNVRSGVTDIVRFNASQAFAHLLAWGIVAPCFDILFYNEPVEKLFQQGLMAGVINIITTCVVGTLLLVVYAKTLSGKIFPGREIN